jgi:hypothetical protein
MFTGTKSALPVYLPEAFESPRDQPMAETPEEFRRRVEENDIKFFDQVSKRADPHRARAFEYEKLAVDFANKGLQSLTYLNGGALVAIPTAMAFVKADIGKTGAAFFVMSRRSESATLQWLEQWQRTHANQLPIDSVERTAREADAHTDQQRANRRRVFSNYWRSAGLLCFNASLFAFVAGCAFGGWAVLLANSTP